MQKAAIFVAATFGILIIGYVDVITGIEVRVTSLYIIPLVFAAYYLRIWYSCILVAFATVVWLYATEYDKAWWVWIINFFTQSVLFLLVVLLVDQRKKMFEEHAKGTIDPLTKLQNRIGFVELSAGPAEICRRYDRPLTLVYMDLDNFKHANDTFGHDFGDELLIKFSKIITNAIRSTDISARVGGDEFIILMPETDLQEANQMAERISKQVIASTEFIVPKVSVSYGLASNSCDIGYLIKVADVEMYKQKKSKK